MLKERQEDVYGGCKLPRVQSVIVAVNPWFGRGETGSTKCV